jgi:oxygen-independent coproporphyrinogen-3 oxidase
MKKELEIYIHIPFCVQKCKYCDFLSGPESDGTKDRYMEALCQEICVRSQEYQNYHISSVFIGGGTPTCVSPRWIEKLMQLIREYYDLDFDAEISMEMNPGTVDRQALEVYYKAGMNRLSIGLQSAKEQELAMLGRIHSYEQFLEAYFTAREIGFLNINVDLMSGLPGQTTEDYLYSLEKVTALMPPPEHISAYSLIIEEGTPFGDAYEKRKHQI